MIINPNLYANGLLLKTGYGPGVLAPDQIGRELLDIDKNSHKRLQEELRGVAARHLVEISDFVDPAFEEPRKIEETYDYLTGLDRELAEERRRVEGKGMHSSPIFPPWARSAARERAIFHALEPKREELLFRKEVSNSGPWHGQRGRATALLTIAVAHELQAQDASEGVYPTMSGPLDHDVLDRPFDDRAPNLKGLTMEDALVLSEVSFQGRPKAKAVKSAQKRMNQLEEFLDAPSTPLFKDIVTYCTDGLGIRGRLGSINKIVVPHLAQVAVGNSVKDPIMSFGSGTALPMLKALREAKDVHGIDGKLLLVDYDPIALAAAASLADKMGLGDNIEIHCQRLFNRFGKPLPLDSITKGRKISTAENAGFAEYVPGWIFSLLLREMMPHMAENGKIVTANMNANRPQKEFLQGMMGWGIPIIHRGVQDVLKLHKYAGIPSRAIQTTVTRDGVYSIYATDMQKVAA